MWKDRPSIDELKNYIPLASGKPINLLDMMLEIEGVKFVYFRDDNNTPSGRFPPKVAAAIAINPRPAVISLENHET